MFLKYYSKNEILKIFEEIDLNLAFKFLISPYLEKKLKGINEIKEISDKIEKSCYIMGFDKSSQYLTPELFIEWIIKNKVIELLIGDSLHIEIIKRCHDIIKFMCKYGHFPLEMLDIIWDACRDKHETTVQALYDLLVEISESLNKEGLDRIY